MLLPGPGVGKGDAACDGGGYCVPGGVPFAVGADGRTLL